MLAGTGKCLFNPKNYREFRETFPWARHKITGEERTSMTRTCTPPLLSLVFCITLTLFPRFEGERYMYREGPWNEEVLLLGFVFGYKLNLGDTVGSVLDKARSDKSIP